jgi:hypothetical protein
LLIDVEQGVGRKRRQRCGRGRDCGRLRRLLLLLLLLLRMRRVLRSIE